MTIHEAQQSIAASLRTISDAPNLDADRILLHVLNKQDASYLIAHSNEIISEQNLQTILDMVEKRKTGMPLAYILGHADFYGRTFIVTPNVLVPRPDTELLIDRALEYVKNNFSDKKEITIADICTGSGIIAITLALELPHTRIIATDISESALHVAKQNTEQHGVADRIEFLQGDLLEPIKNKNIDLIVSNPPYVPNGELASLLPSPYQGEGEDEVSVNAPNQPPSPPSPQLGGRYNADTHGLLFEPRIALDGGEDGLKFVHQIKEYSTANNIPAIIETVGGEIIIEYQSNP